MQVSTFDVIVGRHHSGRTHQALSMAAHRAQTLKRKLLVYAAHKDIDENGYITKIAKEIADLFEIKYVTSDFHHGGYSDDRYEGYVFCVLADEISVDAAQQEAVRRLLKTLAVYKQEVVVSTPSLLGHRDDLRLCSEARAIINSTPVGSKIHLTTLRYEDGDKQPRLHIELIGYRMPFNI